jgi:hypothetical protein
MNIRYNQEQYQEQEREVTLQEQELSLFRASSIKSVKSHYHVAVKD